MKKYFFLLLFAFFLIYIATLFYINPFHSKNSPLLDQPLATTEPTGQLEPFGRTPAAPRKADNGLAMQSKLQNMDQQLQTLQALVSQSQAINEERIRYIEKELQAISLSLQRSRYSTDSDPFGSQDSELEVNIEQTRQRAVAEVERFDAALDAEVREDSWAEQMEDQIDLATRQPIYAGSRIHELICKATFCRVAATHQDLDARDVFELIRRELPNSYHIQHFTDPDGTLRSIAYFIRTGEEEENIIFNTFIQNENSPSSGE